MRHFAFAFLVSFIFCVPVAVIALNLAELWTGKAVFSWNAVLAVAAAFGFLGGVYAPR